MLESALKAATERGYEAMRVSDITGPVGVTRQAFYAHLRDKRHCVAEAIDPKLGAIERMAASLAETDPDAAAAFAHTVDDVIADRFGSPEGTRGRIVNAMIELLRSTGSFHKVRIGTLVKEAHVPAADFYRQFSGKQECFAVAYEQLLDDLLSEIRKECSGPERGAQDVPALFAALADALNFDPDRRRILVIEMAHLPDSAPGEIAGARKPALRDAIAELMNGADDAALRFAASAVVEVIRSTEMSGDPEALAGRLSDLARSMPIVPAGSPSVRLAA